ncbi:MAG: hypothetical protein J2P46_19695 [Zavarzinella sp.]|nr:hypothetical protein [Zavarzinella sp.]
MAPEVDELSRVVNSFPPEMAREVLDFALFLQKRYAQTIDESTEWTDEDLREWSESAARSLDEFEPAVPAADGGRASGG